MSTSAAASTGSSKRTENEPGSSLSPEQGDVSESVSDLEKPPVSLSEEEEGNGITSGSDNSEESIKEEVPRQRSRERRARRKSRVTVSKEMPRGEVELELSTPFKDDPNGSVSENVLLEDDESQVSVASASDQPRASKRGAKKVVRSSVRNGKAPGQSARAGRPRRKTSGSGENGPAADNS
jgi:hypothetical protein